MMVGILNSGLARRIPITVGKEKFSYSEIGGKKLLKLADNIHSLLPEEERGIIRDVTSALESEAGKVAVKNFKTSFKKLHLAELKSRITVEYVLPIKPLTNWMHLTPKTGDVKRSSVVVELAVGVTNPMSEAKRYTNYFVPAVVVVETSTKTGIKNVIISTNTPGVFYARKEPNNWNVPFLKDLMFLKEPRVESVLTMFTTGKVSPAVFNYYKPNEVWSGMFKTGEGYPLNGYYLYGSTKSFELAVVELGGKMKNSNLTVIAKVKKSSTDGMTKKEVNLTTFVPNTIKMNFIDVSKFAEGNVVSPVIYAINGRSAEGKRVAVSFAVTGKTEAISLAPILAMLISRGIVVENNTREFTKDVLPERVYKSVMESMPATGLKVINSEVRLSKENSKIEPARVFIIRDMLSVVSDGNYEVKKTSVVGIPVAMKYSVRDNRYTAIHYVVVAVGQKGAVALAPKVVYRTV